MTTNERNRYYFPAWSACCAANGWRMVKGRLGGLGFDEPETSHQAPEMPRLLVAACQLATAAHRGVTVNDLRHAAHVLALGRDKSSDDITSRETDRIVALFRVLQNADDIAARLEWDAYGRGEDPGAVRRIEYVIRQSPEGYVRALSAAKFGSKAWEELTVKQKGLLAMTLANRAAADRGQFAKSQDTFSSGRPQRAAGEDHTPAPAAAGTNTDNPDWNV